MGFIKSLFTRRLRKSQQGQSLVILAFGFIALAAFVGLVTDISIMFVRFATLRQAVDSAAIAAAGQIREGTDYGTVALTARQYIRMHGLNPTSVWVETCETDVAKWRAEPGNGARPLDQMGDTDLCDWDNPRKLVRVTAQIESETTFLKLIGWEDFILTSSSTSETAVLDVALVLDTSMSMARETNIQSYRAVGLDAPSNTANPDPANRTDPDDPANYDFLMNNANYTTTTIRAGCVKATNIYTVSEWQGQNNLDYGGCCNDPGSGTALAPDPVVKGNWVIYTDLNSNGQMDAGEQGVKNSTSDGNRSDLICEPFKKVKDAARNFIMQLDFVRGDRVSLVTLDLWGRIIFPSNDTTRPAMFVSETEAIATLNQYVGVLENTTVGYNWDCAQLWASRRVAEAGITDAAMPVDQQLIVVGQTRPYAYETIAPCGNTNIGDGLMQGNNTLTDVRTIRRDAVWVMILLTDGAANASGPSWESRNLFVYGNAGFCPWDTICEVTSTAPLNSVMETDPLGLGTGVRVRSEWTYDVDDRPFYNECQRMRTLNKRPSPIQITEVPGAEICNDNDPVSRHFCLVWSNNQANNAQPQDPSVNPNCGPEGLYDADDYARDIADFAALIEVAPGIPGNFIAIFTIGFGNLVAQSPTGAPLLRYIADAGDNGYIDNNVQQDWRDHKDFLRYGVDGTLNGGWPQSYGANDPCYGLADPTAWCGQYYFANDLASLEKVFEAIASRLFTRISR